jgi:hypothetical protein
VNVPLDAFMTRQSMMKEQEEFEASCRHLARALPWDHAPWEVEAAEILDSCSTPNSFLSLKKQKGSKMRRCLPATQQPFALVMEVVHSIVYTKEQRWNMFKSVVMEKKPAFRKRMKHSCVGSVSVA